MQIAKHFPTLYIIPTEKEGLTYIFICFKSEVDEAKYGEIYGRNSEIIFKKNILDTAMVEPFYKEVISQIISISEFITFFSHVTNYLQS